MTKLALPKGLPNGPPKAPTQRPFGAALWSVLGIGLCSGQGASRAASRAACLFRFCHFTFRTGLLVSQSNWLHFSEVGTLFPSRFLPLGLLRRLFNEANGDSHVIAIIAVITVITGSVHWSGFIGFIYWVLRFLASWHSFLLQVFLPLGLLQRF